MRRWASGRRADASELGSPVRVAPPAACHDVVVPPRARPYYCYPYLALGVFALMAADIGVVIRHAVPGPAFTLAWLALSILTAWSWLVCVPMSIEIDDGRLRYAAPVTSGAVPLRRITTVKPLPFLGTAAVVGLAGRVPLVVPLRSGFAPVAAELTGHPCQGAGAPSNWLWVRPPRPRLTAALHR
jgi:hypothetical protein